MSIVRKIWLFFSLMVILTAALWVIISFYQFKKTPLLSAGQSPVTIQLPPGKGTNYLIQLLHEKQLLKHPFAWKTFASIRTVSNHLKAGEYEIKQGTTFEQLLNHIVTGHVLMRPFTIIEGWTYAELLKALRENGYLKHMTQQFNETQVLKMLGSPYRQAEGLFYPDTYFYTWGQSDFTILQQAFLKMKHVLQQAWNARSRGLVYQNVYEALIVASLIEKETGITSEKWLISAVVSNRLKKRMRLQVDPTISYGLGKQRQRIVHSDFKILTPYNTYLHFGLPPTPIALPSESSIQAALHPATVDFLFYVADGNGGHIFSKNYEAHLQAIKAYQNQREKNGVPQPSSE
ncbi:MAG: hypothetical protein A3F10_06040 [Coxiella sp. RIFCSPHIGHO2_12_FULL_42_15]|nr:MAG: hypothetical protein A3F10_06040 [Coxiella sp. RIFCSPHIGHO2_12_FULL_42_15]